MKREIKTTSDNSKTLLVKDLNECYHSHHGALQEAKHVFIKNGINRLNLDEINILEMGLGTGLNVLVTIDEVLRNRSNVVVNYFSLEKYPVKEHEVEALGYSELFEDPRMKDINLRVHSSPWNEPIALLSNFNLTKISTDFFELKCLNIPSIHLVYYDCFGARVQPDLWGKPLFEMVSEKMKIGGLLSTYSSKGSVRRVLQDLNFRVEKCEGPPGKREMLNAWKL